MKSAVAVLVVSLTIATGCVNMSTLQTAKALEPGKQRVLVGGGYYASPSVNTDARASAGSDVSLALPYMEIGYRRGIVENLELGAQVTIPRTTRLDAKYQLVSAVNFAFALCLGANY